MLFSPGTTRGAEKWAIIASLIETCKLNAIDPLTYLTATLTSIINGHKQARIDELLPWKHPTRQRLFSAAAGISKR